MVRNDVPAGVILGFTLLKNPYAAASSLGKNTRAILILHAFSLTDADRKVWIRKRKPAMAGWSVQKSEQTFFCKLEGLHTKTRMPTLLQITTASSSGDGAVVSAFPSAQRSCHNRLARVLSCHCMGQHSPSNSPLSKLSEGWLDVWHDVQCSHKLITHIAIKLCIRHLRYAQDPYPALVASALVPASCTTLINLCVSVAAIAASESVQFQQ